ncbi:MAG: DUF2911 domain-containing protein [Bacteroidota bacterium]
MMKKLCFVLCMLSVLVVEAQQRQIFDPKLSPFQKTEADVGIIKITVEYSRPSMRGRQVFGQLVPYDQLWRTGANRNTKITFDGKVSIGDQVLEAGTYTLFTKPGRDKWEVYFHTELDLYGLPETIDMDKVVASISVVPIQLNRAIETFTIHLDDLKANGATLGISWENVYLPIPIRVLTADILAEKVAAERTTLMEDYRCAANIYFEVEGKSQEALEAINKSIELLQNGKTVEDWLAAADLSDRHLPNKFRLKSEILADLGRMEQAIEFGELSLRIAQKVNDDHYIKLNADNLRSWKTTKGQ